MNMQGTAKELVKHDFEIFRASLDDEFFAEIPLEETIGIWKIWNSGKLTNAKYKALLSLVTRESIFLIETFVGTSMGWNGFWSPLGPASVNSFFDNLLQFFSPWLKLQCYPRYVDDIVIFFHVIINFAFAN